MLMGFHTSMSQGRKVKSICGIFQKSHPPHKPQGKLLSSFYSSCAPSIFIHAANTSMSQAHSGSSKYQKEVEKGIGFHWCFKKIPQKLLYQEEPGLAAQKQGCPHFRKTHFRLKPPEAQPQPCRPPLLSQLEPSLGQVT